MIRWCHGLAFFRFNGLPTLANKLPQATGDSAITRRRKLDHESFLRNMSQTAFAIPLWVVYLSRNPESLLTLLLLWPLVFTECAVRAHSTKNILRRARAQRDREVAVLRQATRRLVHGKLLRTFESWSEYTTTMRRVRGMYEYDSAHMR